MPSAIPGYTNRYVRIQAVCLDFSQRCFAHLLSVNAKVQQTLTPKSALARASMSGGCGFAVEKSDMLLGHEIRNGGVEGAKVVAGQMCVKGRPIFIDFI